MFISKQDLRKIKRDLTQMEINTRTLQLDVINFRKELEGETTIREDYHSTIDKILGSYYSGKSISLNLIVENLIDVLGYTIDYHPTDPPPQKKVSYLLKKNTKTSKKKEKSK